MIDYILNFLPSCIYLGSLLQFCVNCSAFQMPGHSCKEFYNEHLYLISKLVNICTKSVLVKHKNQALLTQTGYCSTKHRSSVMSRMPSSLCLCQRKQSTNIRQSSAPSKSRQAVIKDKNWLYIVNLIVISSYWTEKHI